MDKVEMTAKTTEEAIELALKELDANQEEVEVNIVSRGRAGILGIGAEPARVRVTRLSFNGSGASEAIGIVQELLSLMDIVGTTTIRTSGDENNPAIIDVQGDDSGLLIGRRGETLRSFQFIVNLLLSKKLESRKHVVVDVEQYRERRHAIVRQLALRVAAQVAATGRPGTLDPMPASERRAVHVALADHPNVVTQSTGEREDRKVGILPRGQE
jgi:spoIIIJ-associated protein